LKNISSVIFRSTNWRRETARIISDPPSADK
jgi:hypothetical protein